jgi:hypothetical protein
VDRDGRHSSNMIVASSRNSFSAENDHPAIREPVSEGGEPVIPHQRLERDVRV